MVKQKHLAPAVLTGVTAATIVRRVRRHRVESRRPHGIRRLVHKRR
jgi:hypothetical protein